MITEGRDGGYIPEEDSVSFADEYINELGKGFTSSRSRYMPPK